MKWFFVKYNYDFLFCSIQSTRTMPQTLPQTKTGYAQAGHCIQTLPYTPAMTGTFLCLGCTETWDLVIDCTSLIFCVFFLCDPKYISLNLVWKKKITKTIMSRS